MVESAVSKADTGSIGIGYRFYWLKWETAKTKPTIMYTVVINKHNKNKTRQSKSIQGGGEEEEEEEEEEDHLMVCDLKIWKYVKHKKTH